MSRRECEREQELLDVVRAGRWPDGCGEELRSHATLCVVCGDLVALAAALIDDQRAALQDAHIPPSGLVWWRAQRRARQEAMRTAMKTVTAVQALTIVGAAAFAIAVFGTISFAGIDWSGWLTALAPSTVGQWAAPVLIMAAVWIALAPIALYFAVARD